MSGKRQKQNAFQIELDEALRNRRKREEINPQLMEETETEDDGTDYSDDDFDDDDDSLLNACTKPVVPSKTEKSSKFNQKEKFDWNSAAFMEDDYSDILGNGSMFLKGKKEKMSYSKPSTDDFRFGEIDAPYTEYSVVKDHDLHPKEKSFSDLSNLGSSHKVPTPARRGIGKKQIVDNDSIPRQQRVSSPSHMERVKSPVSRTATPRRQQTPEKGHRSPTHSPDTSLEAAKLRHLDEIFGVTSEGSRKQQKTTNDSRPKPIGSGKSSPIQGILNAMKPSTTKDNMSVHDQNFTKNKNKVEDKSQSFVDFLLEQPKPVPRQKGRKSPEVEPLKLPRKSLSPTFSKSKEEEGMLKKQKSSDSLKHHRSQSPDSKKRLKSPDQHILLPRNESTSFPSLPLTTPQATSLTAAGPVVTPIHSKSQDSKGERIQSKMEADDLLALFNQATSDEPVDVKSLTQQKLPKEVIDGRKTPVEEVIKRTSDQQIYGDMKQRLSRQIMDNAIDVVAEYNVNPNLSSASSKDAEKVKKAPQRKSKKSYRTPPKNYQGLGSLSMLKELKKEKNSQDDDNTHATTEDIRKKVYLEWLAKREAETKKKKQEEARKKKEISEKEQKEREEKKSENDLVRKKWEEVKKEKQKEKQKEKRDKEKSEREDQEKKVKEKLQRQKGAEKRRSLMIEYAKREYEAEKKEKQKKERERNKKECDQKKEREKALNKWMNERSEKWLNDRKQEQKDKQRQENKGKREKQKAAEEAEEKYKRWRDHKDNELKASLRESKQKQRRQMINIDEDEENYQPPWSPPSRVIPRRR